MSDQIQYDDAMLARGARQIQSQWPGTSDDVARTLAKNVLLAMFSEVPLINFGVGTALQFFDMIIGIKEHPHSAAAGVYVSNGDDGFDDLSHTLTVNWASKPSRRISSVSVSKIGTTTEARNAA